MDVILSEWVSLDFCGGGARTKIGEAELGDTGEAKAISVAPKTGGGPIGEVRGTGVGACVGARL